MWFTGGSFDRVALSEEENGIGAAFSFQTKLDSVVVCRFFLFMVGRQAAVCAGRGLSLQGTMHSIEHS